MPVGGVVHDQVDDDPDAAVAGGAEHLDELAVAAEPRIDAVEVGDVVAVVAVGRREERHQPEARDAEVGEVVDAPREPGEVADPVAVVVQVRLDVEAVDDRRLPPQVARVGDLHRRLPQRREQLAARRGRGTSPGPCRRRGGRRGRTRSRRVRDPLGELAGVVGDQHRLAQRVVVEVARRARRTSSGCSMSQSRGPDTAECRHWSRRDRRGRTASSAPRETCTCRHDADRARRRSR